MKSTAALEEFKRMASAAGIDLARCTPDEGVQRMLEFYRSTRAIDCDVEEQQDMLLYQWGTYDWGGGPQFELNVTRQFIRGDAEDENIWQLSLTFRYPPSSTFAGFGKGDRWCTRPQETTEFEAFIRTSTAFQALAQRPAETMELDYECAG